MNQEKIISESEKEKALEILRRYEKQSTHVIRDSIENDCPSQEYEMGEPNGICDTDGHYMCGNCKHFCGFDNLPNYLKPENQ